MTGYRRWRDSGHVERATETVGGTEAFEQGVTRLLDEARAWRLVEMRKHRGVLDRYVTALGGTLVIVADFGDEQMKVG